MREVSPWAVRSKGREQHRAFYAAYITSADWYRRRVKWAAEEAEFIAPATIVCIGGCGRDWGLSRDDMHHCSYDRLGDEAHQDLWPMCRSCHTHLHEILDSTKSWRKLPRRLANDLALEVLRRDHTVGAAAAKAPGRMRDYL